MVIGAPVAELLLPKILRELLPAPLVVGVLCFALSVAMGFAAKTELGRRAGRALERNTLERLPACAALKRIAQGILGARFSATQWCCRVSSLTGSKSRLDY